MYMYVLSIYLSVKSASNLFRSHITVLYSEKEAKSAFNSGKELLLTFYILLQPYEAHFTSMD